MVWRRRQITSVPCSITKPLTYIGHKLSIKLCILSKATEMVENVWKIHGYPTPLQRLVWRRLLIGFVVIFRFIFVHKPLECGVQTWLWLRKKIFVKFVFNLSLWASSYIFFCWSRKLFKMKLWNSNNLISTVYLCFYKRLHRKLTMVNKRVHITHEINVYVTTFLFRRWKSSFHFLSRPGVTEVSW